MEPKPNDDVGPLAVAASSFPLLVYEHTGDQQENFQTVLSIANGSERTIQVPEMCGYWCRETPQGLVLMVDTASGTGSSWLWNPRTGEKTSLPTMDSDNLPECCACQISNSLVLVRPEMLFCRIRGDTEWVKQPYDMGLSEVPGKAPEPMAITAMAAMGGMFLYLEPGFSGEVLVGALVGFTDDPKPWLKHVTFNIPCPNPSMEVTQISMAKNYLLEFDEDLFLVSLFYHGCNLERIDEIGVYVMDFLKKQWCKVTDIDVDIDMEDAAFLLGPGNFGASCSASEHGLKSGCVYFADDDIEGSNNYHIFDIKEGTHEVISPSHESSVLLRKPFWLVPSLS